MYNTPFISKTLSYLTDLIECVDMNGNCTHNCINTEGSYYCTCDNGYELSDDKHTCEGNVM